MLDPALEVEDQSHTVSLVVALADYAAQFAINSDSAIGAARHCLIEALGRGFEALRDPECAALIGPLVPGALMPGGARVPGTSLELDPAQAAFCTALMLCRTASGGRLDSLHGVRVSDPLAAILAVADYQARKALMRGESPPKVRDVLAAIIKALEIQSALAVLGGHHPTGMLTATDRITRAATTAIVSAQLGAALGQIVTAVSYACMDGVLIDAEEVGRGGWARADAAARAVRHACQAMAARPSSYLTSAGLEAVDIAGRVLGAQPTTAAKPFGTGVVDRLALLRKPQEIAQLTIRFQTAVERYFPARQAERIKTLFAAPDRLDDLPVNELLAALVTNGSR